MDSKNLALYNSRLMAAYKESKYNGVLKNPTFISDVKNPSCGDHIIFAGIVEEGIVRDIKFSGDGSMLSQAFAELLCREIIGKPVKDIMALDEEDAKRILAMDMGPTRFQTVSWVLTVLKKGIQGHA